MCTSNCGARHGIRTACCRSCQRSGSLDRAYDSDHLECVLVYLIYDHRRILIHRRPRRDTDPGADFASGEAADDDYRGPGSERKSTAK